MATAVLRPQDCSPLIAFTPRSTPSCGRKTRRPRRCPFDETEVKKEALEMGKVRILKRGDKLSPDSSQGKKKIDRGRSVRFEKVEDQNGVCRKNEKKTVVVVKDKFAGCVVVTSLPPSSLPMPNKYWMKKYNSDDEAAVSMSMDLCRMLKLDLI